MIAIHPGRGMRAKQRVHGGQNEARKHPHGQDAAITTPRADDALQETYVDVSTGLEFQIFMNMEE
jgi:hypothetical protein